MESWFQQKQQDMDNFTSVDTSDNMSLIATEETSLFYNDSISFNYTKEEVAGGPDLPALASAYITYKIGKLLNF